jgi:hypothetical protein
VALATDASQLTIARLLSDLDHLEPELTMDDGTPVLSVVVSARSERAARRYVEDRLGLELARAPLDDA